MLQVCPVALEQGWDCAADISVTEVCVGSAPTFTMRAAAAARHGGCMAWRRCYAQPLEAEPVWVGDKAPADRAGAGVAER